MNAFALLDHIVDDYAAYTRSLLKIRNEDVKGFVDGELDSDALWPDDLVQLNLLTYLPPIFSHVLKHNPEQGHARAIKHEGGSIVKPSFPVDILGAYVSMPVPRGCVHD